MSYSFNQFNRCPNCGGFAGAYRESKRCRGFRHREEGFFCEVPNDSPPKDGTSSKPKAYNFTGHYELYYYKEDSDGISKD